MLFITDNAATWETSAQWREMAWLEAVRLPSNIPVIVPGRDGEGSLPDLRDVDLMLMGV